MKNSQKETDDNQSLDELFSAYYSKFQHFAYTYLRDKDVAEDIVMDSFMYYWEKRDHIENSNPKSYILSTIKCRCLNHLKRAQREQQINEEIYHHRQWDLSVRISGLEACEPSELLSDELKKRVFESLRHLPSKTQKIFVLSRFECLSHKEIAETEGVSKKSVEYHINKAVKLLRITLKDYLLLYPPVFL